MSNGFRDLIRRSSGVNDHSLPNAIESVKNFPINVNWLDDVLFETRQNCENFYFGNGVLLSVTDQSTFIDLMDFSDHVKLQMEKVNKLLHQHIGDKLQLNTNLPLRMAVIEGCVMIQVLFVIPNTNYTACIKIIEPNPFKSQSTPVNHAFSFGSLNLTVCKREHLKYFEDEIEKVSIKENVIERAAISFCVRDLICGFKFNKKLCLEDLIQIEDSGTSTFLSKNMNYVYTVTSLENIYLFKGMGNNNTLFETANKALAIYSYQLGKSILLGNIL